MLRAFSAALRPRPSTRPLRILAVVTAVSSVMLAGPITAQAAQVESGSVEVEGLTFVIAFQCAGGCTDPAPQTTSSGSISGLGDLGPFTAVWAAPPLGTDNAVPSISYTPLCVSTNAGQFSVGALIDDSSSLTITNASLTYAGSVAVHATVTMEFSGRLADGVFVPLTNVITVSGGGHTIYIGGLGIPGSMAAVPVTPPPANCAGTQTFTASGNFLTFGDG